jgi:site-specific recombinase XerD
MLTEIDRFINWQRRRNSNARTWRDYSYDLKQFANIIGDQPPNSVTFHDIDHFIIQQGKQGNKPATINRRLAAISSFYAFLSDEDPALVCPVLPHRHKLREPKRLPRPIPSEDLKKFFQVICSSRDRAMFILMLRCGLRISEVASLKLIDLYLEDEPPRLVTGGKGTKERAVYLSPQAKQAVVNYLSERLKVPSEFVFLSYLGNGLSTTAIHKRLMRYRTEAEVTITAHRLRHTFANDLVSADVPVTSIQKLLGHTWLETTQTYVAANDKQVQADYYAACCKLETWQ